MRRTRRRPLLIALLLATLTACGTTVPGQQALTGTGSGVPGALTGDGLGGTVAPDGTVIAPDGTTAVGSGESLGGVAAGPVAGGVTAPGTSGAVGEPGQQSTFGTGTTAKPGKITIGLIYPDTAALAAIFGRDATNPRTWFEKIIAYINKNGGIGGRQLTAVYYAADVAKDSSQLQQEACAAFTEDNKVDVVIAGAGETFLSCIARKGLSSFDTNAFATDATDLRRFPNLFMPDAMGADLFYDALLDVSAQRGLLPRGATLGVIVEDCPFGRRVYSSTFIPAAKTLGLTLVQGTHRCVENLVSDLGPVTNDIQREVLRFRSQGVTHVVALSRAEAFVVSRFTQTARDQQYRPKYLVTSHAYPWQNGQPDATIQISQDALPNMTGVGAFPLWDVGDGARPDGAGQVSAQRKCKEADPDEGTYRTNPDDGRYFARQAFLGYCDAFFVLKAVLETNGMRFGIADMGRGYAAALSGRTPSAVLAGGSFMVGGGRSDGAGLVRPFAYDASKQTFVYSGSAIRVR